jgi:hypothetical protein
MRKLALCGLVLLCGIGGCKSKHEALADDAMALMNEMVDVLESVTDDASAQAAVAKLEKIGGRMKELQERSKALGTAPKEEQDRLKQKFTANMENVKKRMEAVGPKVGKYPAVMTAFIKAMMGSDRNVGVPGGGPFGAPPGGFRPPLQ